MPYRNKRTARLYARLWARVRNAADALKRDRQEARLRRRFRPRPHLSPEERKVARLAKQRRYVQRHPERLKERERRTYQRLKVDIVAHYTKGRMNCQWPGGCSTLDFDELQLDHADGDWSMDVFPDGRRMHGTPLYRKVIAEGFPPRFRILCGEHNRRAGPLPFTYVGTSMPERRAPAVAALYERRNGIGTMVTDTG